MTDGPHQLQYDLPLKYIRKAKSDLDNAIELWGQNRMGEGNMRVIKAGANRSAIRKLIQVLP